MYNIIATFKSMPDLNHCMKNLRGNPNIRGHMLVIPKNTSVSPDKEISSILIKRSKQIASSGLEDIRLGVITGLIIGSLSTFLAVYLNTSLLHLSTISFIAGLAIIFYGGACGAILGFLTNTIISKYNWSKRKGEATLVLQKLDDDTRELVIKNLAEHHVENYEIF
ncbi:MAG: hypothetical protein ACOYVK_07050 [Bacillota bacterium]